MTAAEVEAERTEHDHHICDYDGTTDDCNVTEDKGDEK